MPNPFSFRMMPDKKKLKKQFKTTNNKIKIYIKPIKIQSITLICAKTENKKTTMIQNLSSN